MSCPICGAPPQKEARPFCSKRCADIDLGNWMSGKYFVPSQELEDTDELDQSLNPTVEKPH